MTHREAVTADIFIRCRDRTENGAAAETTDKNVHKVFSPAAAAITTIYFSPKMDVPIQLIFVKNVYNTVITRAAVAVASSTDTIYEI